MLWLVDMCGTTHIGDVPYDTSHLAKAQQVMDDFVGDSTPTIIKSEEEKNESSQEP